MIKRLAVVGIWNIKRDRIFSVISIIRHWDGTNAVGVGDNCSHCSLSQSISVCVCVCMKINEKKNS